MGVFWGPWIVSYWSIGGLVLIKICFCGRISVGECAGGAEDLSFCYGCVFCSKKPVFKAAYYSLNSFEESSMYN